MPAAGERPPAAHLWFAWAGAAAFLASLLWGAYCYLIGFDRRPAPFSTGAALSCDVALFSIFALHHSALARTGAKQQIKRLAPPALERSIYTWTASLLFIAVCTWWQPVPGVFYRAQGAWRWVAYAVASAGVILTIRSSAALDVFDLAGVRQVQRARDPAPVQHVALETTGLYGFVRHPLYFAWALMVFAAPDMTATRALFAAISTGYLALAIPWEERSLVEIFGPAYERYRTQVRWRMIPGIY